MGSNRVMIAVSKLFFSLLAIGAFNCGCGDDSQDDIDADASTDTDTDIDTDTDTDTDTGYGECAFECVSDFMCSAEDGFVHEEMKCEGSLVCCETYDDTDSQTDAGGDYWEDGYCPTPDGQNPASNTCMDIAYEGCCDEEGRVIWCVSGFLFCQDCVSDGQICTWATSLYGDHDYYACRDEYTGSDPSGVFPENCDGTWPDAGVDAGERTGFEDQIGSPPSM